MMNSAIKEKLEMLALEQTWDDISSVDGDDYLDIDGFAGGQTDDAYYGGKKDGRIELARELLMLLSK